MNEAVLVLQAARVFLTEKYYVPYGTQYSFHQDNTARRGAGDPAQLCVQLPQG